MSVRPFDPSEEENDSSNKNAGLSRIESSQINMQIATAKQFPRSIKKFLAASEAMVTIDEDVAWECVYRLKRKEKDGRDKFIEGPSVRLLEICASNYCNLRYGSRILGEDGDNIVAEGIAWDLENNVLASQQVLRRIVTKDGNRYGSDMMTLTANAAASIAKRNALNGIVPRVYVNLLMEKAKEVSSKSAKPFGERVQKCLAKFKALHVTEAQILEKLEIDELAKMTPEHLELLYGTYTALKEGTVTIEEEFPIDMPVKSNAPNFVGKTEPKKADSEPKPQPKKEPKVEKPAEPAPSNVTPLPSGGGEKLSGDVPTGANYRVNSETDDVSFGDASDSAPTPAPVKTGDGPNMIKLKGLMEAGKVSIAEFEDYARNSSPLILAEDKSMADISDAKCGYVLKIWPKIYATIKPS